MNKIYLLLVLCFMGCVKESSTIDMDSSTYELLVSSGTFSLYRVTVNGTNYLISSRGGIVRE